MNTRVQYFEDFSFDRAKHRVDAAKSKFFMLKRVRSGQKPSGLIQGVVHSAEFGPKGLVICTENGSYLELKVWKLHPLQLFFYFYNFISFICNFSAAYGDFEGLGTSLPGAYIAHCIDKKHFFI